MTGIRDYSTTADANLSVAGISLAEGWARASVNNAFRAKMADIADLLLDLGGGTSTTGSGNAFLLDLPTAPTSYDNNLMFVCRLNHAITGPATININGLGVKPLKKLVDGVASPLEEDDGFAGDRPICIYSTADNCVLMLSMGGTGSFTQDGGGETWPVKDRMKQQVYLLDFIPRSEHDAILNSTSTYDCSDAFEAAMNCMDIPVENTVPYMGGPEVIFPYGTCYFTRNIEIKKTMILTGQGSGHRQASASRMHFAAGITGIVVNSRTTFEGDMDPPVWQPPSVMPISKGGDATTIRNLRITSASGGVADHTSNETGSGCDVVGGVAVWDKNHHGWGHGIWVRAACLIENCQIQYFPQHGIYIRAASNIGTDTPEGRAVYGNANLTQIYHTMSLGNGGCGLYIDGPDTNACLFYGMDISGNRLSGIRDSCLIGNTHIMPHTDINGMDALCSFSDDGITSWRYYCRDEFRANNNAPVWASATAYSSAGRGDYVRNAGNLYRCILGGTSSGGGAPTGTGTSADGISLRWIYVAADAGIRIPPAGHAQSADVWAKVFPSISQANPDTHPFYPVWPAGPGGVTPHNYRLGFNFWFDQVSAKNVLIGPYVESDMPYSLILAPSMVIGSSVPLDAFTTGIKYDSNTVSAVISPGILVPAARATSARDFSTSIHAGANQSMAWIVSGDHVSGTSFNWDDTTGIWRFQHANNASRIPLAFSTDLTTLTGGRAGVIGAGNTIHQQGMWLGRAATYLRHLSMAEAVPTTGQWAAGDYVLNATPSGVGSILGWRCVTTGDFAGTPPVFQAVRPSTSMQTIVASAVNPAFTLTPSTSPYHTLFTGTLPGDRAVTLTTSLATSGMTYRITRTASGAFVLNVGTGPLIALAANRWCDVTYDGTAYYLSAFGSLDVAVPA